MYILSQVSSKEAGLIVALHNQVRARVARGEEKRGRWIFSGFLPFLIKKRGHLISFDTIFPKNETIIGEAGGF